MVGTDCLQKCETCNGDCYFKKGGVFCQNCTEGYDLASICQGCITGYQKYQEQCLRVCDTCDYGTCFYYQHTVVCSACHNGAELSQCKNCREGFVLHEGHCQPLIPGTECVRVAGAVVCLSCNEGEYLIAEQCYPACKLPFCRNGECYESPTPICSSCYPNFQMQPNGSCLEIRQHEGGVCTVEQKPLCDCYEGYGGPICEACSQNANFLDDRCFQDCKVSSMTCHGICQISFGYSQVVIICSECHIGYRLPGCQLCVDGFKLNVDNECKLCEDGWLDQSMLPVDVSVVLGEGCYKKCIICEQGDCWYQGPSIKCVSCSPGYSFTNNCQTCESGYTLIGGRCLVLQDTPDGICGEYSDQVCQSCQQDMALLQCQVCESGHVQYDDQCYVPLSFMSGNCISLYESEFICQDESICKEGYLFFDEQFCIECSSEYILMNFTCWIQLAKYEMLYSGDCLQKCYYRIKIMFKMLLIHSQVYIAINAKIILFNVKTFYAVKYQKKCKKLVSVIKKQVDLLFVILVLLVFTWQINFVLVRHQIIFIIFGCFYFYYQLQQQYLQYLQDNNTSQSYSDTNLKLTSTEQYVSFSRYFVEFSFVKQQLFVLRYRTRTWMIYIFTLPLQVSAHSHLPSCCSSYRLPIWINSTTTRYRTSSCSCSGRGWTSCSRLLYIYYYQKRCPCPRPSSSASQRHFPCCCLRSF
uniref:Cysteine-rich membrane protein 2 n=1 Tax=Spironucleus salmonicida TaxID=348837 RepID=V6LH00_9EUKA|eukprot:EST42986.1 Cysteine-rich membrane protein 2 [Spironucleus salmonicida]